MIDKNVDINELIQVYIVNEDLLKKFNMGMGKVAGQVAHVATLLSADNKNKEEFKFWLENDQKKIIKKAKEKDLINLMEKLDIDEIPFKFIRDLGLTEIPKDSLTVVGLGPMRRFDIDKYVNKRWRLLK